MAYVPENPLIVQSDRSLLLEVNNARYEEARDELARFAELVKSPEFIHTYQITPLSLWNAASAGEKATDIIATLERFAKFDLPPNIVADIADYVSRYGRLRLVRRDDGALALESDDEALIAQVWHTKQCRPLLVERDGTQALIVEPAARGHIKQALVNLGFPAEDLAGYVEGADLTLAMRDELADGRPFELRPYQQSARRVFYDEGSSKGGSGVIVLPCGAGKTVVGIGVMALLAMPDTDSVAKHRRRAPMDRRTAGENDPDAGSDRRIHRRAQRDQAGDDHHLPDADVPSFACQHRDGRDHRVSPFWFVQRARLGADHLRRGASAASADLSHHRRDSGAATPGPDGDAGARGPPRNGCLFLDRAEEVRRAMA